MSKRKGIPSLTGIRGVAAVWVMLFHAQQNAGTLFGLPALERNPIFTNGWHGVDPVSYTHLDVYKRQGVHSLIR